VVLRIRQELKARDIAVWIDVEEMHGSTIDSMAAAVEGASCMLVCMSKAYKESANCRLEANYAQARGVPMVFAKLEEGYHPNGWAGHSARFLNVTLYVRG
jgi:male-specific lethal 1